MPARKVLPLAQAAGLAALGVIPVVAAVGDEFVGVLQDIGARRHIAVIDAHIIGGRAHNGGKDVIGRQGAQNQVGVPGGGDVVGVQAAGVHKGRAGAAYGGGLIVHHRNKVVNTAAAHIVGHDVGGLVAAGQQHGVQQIAQAVRLAPADVSGRGVGALFPDQIINITRRSQADRVELVLIAFQQKQRCHHLGQARSRKRHLAVFVIDNDVRVEVDHIGSRGRK